jgi:hypothetical protein
MRILLAIASGIALQCSAAAQSSQLPLAAQLQAFEGTISAKHITQFASGKLFACIIEFAAVVRDRTTRVGQYSRVGGSFGFMSASGTIVPVMKVTVHDVNLSTGDLLPAAPHSAYVAYGTGTNANEVVSSGPSDAPGSIFVVFSPKATIEVFFDAIVNQEIKILFNRTGKDIDIPLNLDLRVEDTTGTGERRRSDRASTEMMTCVTALVKAAAN